MPIRSPVALFTYNRPEHTRATLEALVRNTLAPETDLYVFSDGPKSDADTASVASVREVVRGVSGFASVSLITRSVNMGLANSVITGVSELLREHSRIIVLEDDLVTTKNFIAFMNDALDRYSNDPKAFSVTGYRLPEGYLHIPRDFPYDTFAGYRCSSWSWGTWRDRWNLVDWDMSYFADFMKDEMARAEFDKGGRDLTKMLRQQKEGKIDSWAIRFSFAHYANDMRCMYPRKSLVQNIGLDNSGVHTKPNPRFVHTKLEDDWYPKRFSPADVMDPRIAARFVTAFNGPLYPRQSGPFRGINRAARKVASYGRSLPSFLLSFAFGSPSQVDILTVNTYQKKGGAARAAWRVFSGIRQIYPNSVYLTLVREDSDSAVWGLDSRSIRGKIARRFTRHEKRLLRRYSLREGSFFSPSLSQNPLRISLARTRPALVHLNWVVDGVVDFDELVALKRPVVWTLHDTWAFTGGCHYTGDCTRYREECGQCPQLGSSDAFDISRQLIQTKAEVYRKMDLTIVCPSRWLAEIAAESSLLAGRRIEVIPNGLDTDVFKPYDQEVSRSHFGIPIDECVILFGAQSLNDPRKGSDLLIECLGKLKFPCTLLTFGDGDFFSQLPDGVRLHALGNIKNDDDLAMAYSAADVFVCASREDNLPNTIAEALACGTPCAAFDVAGLSDMIDHRVNGWLARPFDTDELAAGIKWLTNRAQAESLRLAAREKAIKEYDLASVSSKYAKLFDELMKAADL